MPLINYSGQQCDIVLFIRYREYEHTKGPGRKQTKEDMDQPVPSVIRRDMSLKDAVSLFHIPYSSLKTGWT